MTGLSMGEGRLALASLRSTAFPPPSASDPFVVARITIEFPGELWISAFSRNHPDLRIEAGDALTVGEKYVVCEFEMLEDGGNVVQADWTREIASHPDVLRVDRIPVAPGAWTYRVVSHEPGARNLFGKFGILVRSPSVTRNGIVTMETIARRSQVQGFVAGLRSLGVRVRLLAIRGDMLRYTRVVLTPPQRRLLDRAVGAGYFEVPRRITLTRLAQELSRSKSSVSESLAKIERKLVTSATRPEL